MIPHLRSLMIPLFLPVLLSPLIHAYIPAEPTNSTQLAIQNGLNITDISKLNVKWFSNGSYNVTVSYARVGGGDGVSQGVLVRFSEDIVSNDTAPTTTPWIALISCDRNATNASTDLDIFTLAQRKGAVAALLYSLTSVACILTPSPPSFIDIDIFTTQSLASSHLIEDQFAQLTNSSIRAYNATLLDLRGGDVNQSIELGYPVAWGFMFSVLQAWNATENVTVSGAPETKPSGGDDPRYSGVAVIIALCAIGLAVLL